MLLDKVFRLRKIMKVTPRDRDEGPSSIHMSLSHLDLLSDREISRFGLKTLIWVFVYRPVERHIDEVTTVFVDLLSLLYTKS